MGNPQEPAIPIHPLRRAKERYGVDFTVADLCRIARLVRGGDGIRNAEADDGSVVYIIKYADRWFRVVLNAAMSRVLTFLPMRGPAVCRGRVHNPSYQPANDGRAYYRKGRKFYRGTENRR